MEKALTVLVGLVFAAFMVLGIWLWVEGPCWLWTFSKAGEAPIRCVR